MAKKKAAKKSAKKSKGKRGGAGNKAFMIPLTPSASLALVVGKSPLPRTMVVKKLWAYIKKNKLQDKVNKRIVVADEKLKAIFGKAKVNMFEMMKLLKKHLK